MKKNDSYSLIETQIEIAGSIKILLESLMMVSSALTVVLTKLQQQDEKITTEVLRGINEKK